MGRPPRPIKRITVSARFEPDEMALIDKMRGKVTRQEWIHAACMVATGNLAARQDFTERLNVAGTNPDVDRRFGPRKAKPGARLKGGKGLPQ